MSLVDKDLRLGYREVSFRTKDAVVEWRGSAPILKRPVSNSRLSVLNPDRLGLSEHGGPIPAAGTFLERSNNPRADFAADAADITSLRERF